MADLADVEDRLVTLVVGALYPEGLATPSSVATDCRIYRGWPTPAGLDADLKAGWVNITIFPDSTPGRTMTRYPSEWHGKPAKPTLEASVLGNMVTFSGSADLGQLAGIRIAGDTFAYRTVGGDTPQSVAANLATMIRGRQIVQLSGTTLTVPGGSSVSVRVVRDAPGLREIRRQAHDIRVSLWCPTPVLRDSVGAVVDTALAGLTFIDFPDTSVGHITYKSTSVFDQSQSASLYRRDLIYSIEYPTVISTALPAMLFGDIALGATNVPA